MNPLSNLLRVFVLTTAFPICLLGAETYRTYTNHQGRKLTAAFVSTDGSRVVLRTPDGRLHTLPLETLSMADQQHVKAQAGRLSPAPATAPQGGSSPPPPPPSAGAAGPLSLGGMAFAANWMPQRVETKRELLENIVFYSKQVLGDRPRGQEKAPAELSPGIPWLMPFDQVMSRLPGRVIKMGERSVNNNCFPGDSLSIASFQFKSFMDQGRPFNLLHLLLDLKRQVVGVEFVQQTPGKTTYQVEGKLEPYYNFFTLTNNGSTRKEVVYAVLPGSGPGVKVIQTVLRDWTNDVPNGLPQIPGSAVRPGPGMPPGLPMPMVNPVTPGALNVPVKAQEIVHWYLAEPFARCLLEIAEKNGVRAP